MSMIPECNPNGNCLTRTILRHGICEKCRTYCSYSAEECHCDGFREECLQPSSTTQRITPSPSDPSVNNTLIIGLVLGLAVFAIAAAAILWGCYRRQIRRTAHQLYRKFRPQRYEGPDEEPDENIELMVPNQVAGAEDHRDAESIVARNGSVSGAQDQPNVLNQGAGAEDHRDAESIVARNGPATSDDYPLSSPIEVANYTACNGSLQQLFN